MSDHRHAMRRVGLLGLVGGLLCGALAGASPAVADLLADDPNLNNVSRAAEITAITGRVLENGADPRLLEEFIRQSQAASLSESDILDVLLRVERLVGRDLPVSPVLSRYLQGLAKRVDFGRVDIVAADLEQRLERAARRVDAVFPAPTDAETRRTRLASIDHGAYALGAGVSEDDLDRSIRLAREESQSLEGVAAPILTLGILVSAGVTSEKSVEVVTSAWHHGYRGSDLERLGTSLGRLGRDGEGPPVEVVDQILALIGDDATQDRVFQGLDALIGRGQDALRPPGVGPGEDPSTRGGDTGHIETPNDQPRREQDRPVPTIGS